MQGGPMAANLSGIGNEAKPVALAPASVSGIGAAMSAAAAAIKPPSVDNHFSVIYNIRLDGAAIAAWVESHITNDSRTVNGTSGGDSGATYLPTDGIGHQ